MILPAVGNGGFCNFYSTFFLLKYLFPVFNWKNYVPLFFKTDTYTFSRGRCSCVIQSASVAALTRDVFFHSVCEPQQRRNKVRPFCIKTAQISLKYE